MAVNSAGAVTRGYITGSGRWLLGRRFPPRYAAGEQARGGLGSAAVRHRSAAAGGTACGAECSSCQLCARIRRNSPPVSH